MIEPKFTREELEARQQLQHRRSMPEQRRSNEVRSWRHTQFPDLWRNLELELVLLAAGFVNDD
ncbi:MAG: hypothetical protein C5B58_15300 [Acidobacteria bacterium]|nr:MAG: hypothetical protein C5B58_15300 [Acidobacteriota bacterium]